MTNGTGERRANRISTQRPSFSPSIGRVPAAVDDVDGWAAGIAAALPPLTVAEAAAVGRIAAALDARRASAGNAGGDRAAA